MIKKIKTCGIKDKGLTLRLNRVNVAPNLNIKYKFMAKSGARTRTAISPITIASCLLAILIVLESMIIGDAFVRDISPDYS